MSLTGYLLLNLRNCIHNVHTALRTCRHIHLVMLESYHDMQAILELCQACPHVSLSTMFSRLVAGCRKIIQFMSVAGQLLFDLGHCIDDKRVQAKGPQQSICCTKSYHGLRDFARVDEALQRLVFALWPRLLEVSDFSLCLLPVQMYA